LSDRIDLKSIERKAYTSYHEDGIIDIFIGGGSLSAPPVISGSRDSRGGILSVEMTR
jgi:hypothetical protein